MAKKREIEQPEIRYTTGGIALTEKGLSLVIKHNLDIIYKIGNIPQRIQQAKEAIAKRQQENDAANKAN